MAETLLPPLLPLSPQKGGEGYEQISPPPEGEGPSEGLVFPLTNPEDGLQPFARKRT